MTVPEPPAGVPPVVLDGLDSVRAAVGRELGPTAWVEVTAERVACFGMATGMTPRAAAGASTDVTTGSAGGVQGSAGAPTGGASGSIGAPSGRGGVDEVPSLLLLALTNLLLPELVEVRGVSSGINVGTGPVRFPMSVPVGARVRGRATVVAADEARGGVQTTIRITVEVEGRDGPALVVDALSRWLA